MPDDVNDLYRRGLSNAPFWFTTGGDLLVSARVLWEKIEPITKAKTIDEVAQFHDEFRLASPFLLLCGLALEDEEVDARQVLDQIAARAGRFGFREVGDQIEGAADQDPPAGADRADRDRGRDVRFPDARRSNEQDARVGLDKARAGEFDEFHLRELRIEGPLEIGERLHRHDAGLLEPARIEPVGPTGEFVLDQQLEEVEVRERRGLGLGDAAGERFGLHFHRVPDAAHVSE